MRKRANVLRHLNSFGFDESYNTSSGVKVKCSQCEALVINGVATHETGCSNQKYECKGCNNLISYKGYCEDCQ